MRGKLASTKEMKNKNRTEGEQKDKKRKWVRKR